MKAGQKRRSERKFFPDVLVQMDLDDETWHLVKETPKVMGFIGGKVTLQHQLQMLKQRRYSKE